MWRPLFSMAILMRIYIYDLASRVQNYKTRKINFKLKKSLYGLKQSPRQWYKWFDKFICSKRYIQSPYDPCFYFSRLSDGEYIYLLLYVDDILIASKSRSTIKKLKSLLSSEFEMKDMKEVKRVLGMKIDRDRRSGKVCLTSKGYLQIVLQKFNISSDTRSISTPLSPHFNLAVIMSLKSVKECEYMSHVPYASVVVIWYIYNGVNKARFVIDCKHNE